MKWNVLATALVVGVGVCSQSQGFELLDRMLGTGCGCAPCAAQACCEKPCGVAADPGCGCAVDPGCGLAADPGCGLAADPGCGCAADPGCGCAAASGGGCGPASCGCQDRCRPRLLDALFCGHRCRQSCGAPSCGCGAQAACGCAADPGCGAASGCGCASACDSGCRRRCHRSLLDALFCCDRSCGSSQCGCGNGGCGGCGGCAAPACGDPCGCGEPVGGAVEIGDGGAADDAPMPPAPMADPNARVSRRSLYMQASLTR
jgi:hypothetical protein